MLLEINNLKKCFFGPQGQVTAEIYVPKLKIDRGELLVLEGPSGSGKTTLLHMISGLLRPDEGQVLFDGIDLCTMTNKERDLWRAYNIGYIFQRLNLLEALTVEENIMLASYWSGIGHDDLQIRVYQLLDMVGLADRAKAFPCCLSLGEQQRVAVVRALLNRPALLLADEPTASLDIKNSSIVLQLLQELCQQEGIALILSTHDEAIKAQFKRRYNIREGEASA